MSSQSTRNQWISVYAELSEIFYSQKMLLAFVMEIIYSHTGLTPMASGGKLNFKVSECSLSATV